MCARFLALGRIPPVTPITHDTWSGSDSSPMSISGSRLATCPESKHSCSGRMPSSFIAVDELDDRVERVLEHGLEHEVLALRRVLRVVHRAHVERGHVRPQLAQVLDPLLDRDADRAGRVVDDHVVHRAADRLGDRAEVLHLVARHAVGRARVDVDHRAALVHRPLRLRRVLLGRVRDRRALLAVRHRSRDRAGDDAGPRRSPPELLDVAAGRRVLDQLSPAAAARVSSRFALITRWMAVRRYQGGRESKYSAAALFARSRASYSGASSRLAARTSRRRSCRRSVARTPRARPAASGRPPSASRPSRR